VGVEDAVACGHEKLDENCAIASSAPIWNTQTATSVPCILCSSSSWPPPEILTQRTTERERCLVSCSERQRESYAATNGTVWCSGDVLTLSSYKHSVLLYPTLPVIMVFLSLWRRITRYILQTDSSACNSCPISHLIHNYISWKVDTTSLSEI
jgi:hypothetical protein